ncbi:MAG: hypothetical protein ACTSUK_07235 [Promethearchaeota archaeon]
MANLLEEISDMAKGMAKEIIESVEYSRLSLFCDECDGIEMKIVAEIQNHKRYRCPKCCKSVLVKVISEEDLKFLLFNVCSEYADMHEVCIEKCRVKEIADSFNLNINEIGRDSE